MQRLKTKLSESSMIGDTLRAIYECVERGAPLPDELQEALNSSVNRSGKFGGCFV